MQSIDVNQVLNQKRLDGGRLVGSPRRGKEACLGLRPSPMRKAMRSFGPPPSAAEIEALARRALERLPEPFASSLDALVLRVEEFAEADVLAELGLQDPFELTGLYTGRPLTGRSVEDAGALPDTVTLYRRPILDEWADGCEELEHLVAHVLVHEVGHHFGLSDGDMHALEAEAR
jgi:predicted Zn-dependent protease with MMP-like domain